MLYNIRVKLIFILIALNAFLLPGIRFAFAQVAQSDSTVLLKYKEIAVNITSAALRERIGYEMLRELCQIGPRLSGSEESLKAISWAFDKMTELGFDSVWLQPVMVPNWKRGNIEKCTIVNTVRELSILALGGSVPTPQDGITAGVIEVKSFDELEQRKEEAKGKIVFFSRAVDQGKVNTFSGYGEAVNQRTRGAIEAAKYGAVGVLIRSVTTKYDNVPHTGVMGYADSLPKIPAAALGYLDADLLSEELKKHPDLKVKFLLNCETLPDTQSYNVIGEIKGTDFPDEIILVGGHFDSWDAGCGAHDDGGGCIQSMEVLDLFKRLNIKPKRTIRCVLFINEENGLRGATVYANYALQLNEYHLAAIESDRGVFTPVGFSVESDSMLLLNKLQSWLPILEIAGIEWIKKGGSGVDVSQIKNAGILIGFVPDDQRYMDVHHSANDVFEAVHPRELESGTAAIAIMVYLLSEEGL